MAWRTHPRADLTKPMSVFLRVITIVDVASGDGNQLLRELFNVYLTKNGDMTQWPLQQNPKKGVRTLWNIHLIGLVCSESTLKLTQPLGDWTAKAQQSQ
jgi:hypothetical protein